MRTTEANFNSSNVPSRSRSLTASIGTDQSVPPAVVELNPGVAEQFHAMEGDGEVVDVDVPRCWVGRKNACH